MADEPRLAYVEQYDGAWYVMHPDPVGAGDRFERGVPHKTRELADDLLEWTNARLIESHARWLEKCARDEEWRLKKRFPSDVWNSAPGDDATVLTPAQQRVLIAAANHGVEEIRGQWTSYREWFGPEKGWDVLKRPLLARLAELGFVVKGSEECGGYLDAYRWYASEAGISWLVAHHAVDVDALPPVPEPEAPRPRTDTFDEYGF